jgi:hypothetical protein
MFFIMTAAIGGGMAAATWLIQDGPAVAASAGAATAGPSWISQVAAAIPPPIAAVMMKNIYRVPFGRDHPGA